MSANQTVVQHQVDQIAGQVGPHGNPGVAHPPLGSVDHQGKDIEDHAADDDVEIGLGRVDRVRSRAGEQQDLPAETHSEQPQHQSQENRQLQAEEHGPVRPCPVPLPFAPGNHRGKPDIQGEEGNQGDELRLSTQPYGADRVGPKDADHHRVDQAHQRNQKLLDHRRPGNLQGMPYQPSGRWHGTAWLRPRQGPVGYEIAREKGHAPSLHPERERDNAGHTTFCRFLLRDSEGRQDEGLPPFCIHGINPVTRSCKRLADIPHKEVPSETERPKFESGLSLVRLQPHVILSVQIHLPIQLRVRGLPWISISTTKKS